MARRLSDSSPSHDLAQLQAERRTEDHQWLAAGVDHCQAGKVGSPWEPFISSEQALINLSQARPSVQLPHQSIAC